MLSKLNALKSAECRVYHDANVIRNIANSLDDSTDSPAPAQLCFLQDLASLIANELKFILCQLKEIASFDEIAVQVLRARIEYWCLTVNTIVRKVEYFADTDIMIATPSCRLFAVIGCEG